LAADRCVECEHLPEWASAIIRDNKAIKTIFLCRHLHEEALRREIHEGLNVVENWNSANSEAC
jgi:TnpA family transposase